MDSSDSLTMLVSNPSNGSVVVGDVKSSIPACAVNTLVCISGVITPNKIPLTTIVTYLQKGYRSRISNHWATIPACSVVPPIYEQSKKTYCHISF